MKKRKTKLLKCEILNAPLNKEEQKDYDRRVCRALAVVIDRELEPGQVDIIIERLKGRVS
jgi:hypothetical protein